MAIHIQPLSGLGHIYFSFPNGVWECLPATLRVDHEPYDAERHGRHDLRFASLLRFPNRIWERETDFLVPTRRRGNALGTRRRPVIVGGRSTISVKLNPPYPLTTLARRKWVTTPARGNQKNPCSLPTILLNESEKNKNPHSIHHNTPVTAFYSFPPILLYALL